MKLAVIYHSETENTKQAAEWIADGMNENSNCNKTFYNIEANMFYNSYAIYKYRTPNENINW